MFWFENYGKLNNFKWLHYGKSCFCSWENSLFRLGHGFNSYMLDCQCTPQRGSQETNRRWDLGPGEVRQTCKWAECGTSMYTYCIHSDLQTCDFLETHWLVVSTPLKNMSSKLGWLFPIYGRIKVMFQSPPTSSQHTRGGLVIKYLENAITVHRGWSPATGATPPRKVHSREPRSETCNWTWKLEEFPGARIFRVIFGVKALETSDFYGYQ